LSRAGVAANRPSTSTSVPATRAAGRTGPSTPPRTVTEAASAAPAAREVTVSRATAPSEASASPRKPKLVMLTRSSPSSFEVACRASASASSSAGMPQPSSDTRISRLPPSAIATSIRRAPASSAFSTSSLTAEAGRSTTSPAAIRFVAAASRSRIGRRPCSILGWSAIIPQEVARSQRVGYG